MFYRKRRYQRKPVKGKKRVARKGAKRVVSRAVKTYVKRILHKNIENKIVIEGNSNIPVITASAGTPPFYLNLCPSIAQGAAGNGRIGNEVRVVKAWTKGYINLLPYNVSSNPCQPVRVRMFLVSSKSQNAAAISGVPPSHSDFFQSGAGQNAPFVGNMLDMVRTVNTDNWVLHAQRNLELGFTSASGTGYYATNSIPDNSKFTLPFYFNFAKILNKIKFDDGGNYATNKNLYLFIQAVDAAGTYLTQQSCEIHFNTRWEYEDA